ncbi:MAG: transporter [Candidatus Saccharibacteria bacterium]|nr:transporter [Candidatus Saccharibacteria bacterium]
MSRSKTIIRTYLTLNLFNTFAASLIWGINTLFLLDAGLSIVEAFAANAFFTAGMVLFEIPTGVIADSKGRRLSYLLGTLTLALTTLLYLVLAWTHAPFILWAIVSLFLGLGFTFFSGATDAWLVDALKFTKYKGQLDSVFGKAQVVGGIAMLVGSVSGGLIAQFSNLGVPYIVRAGLLVVTFIIAFKFMKDLGFSPEKGIKYSKAIKAILKTSIRYGLGKPAVRWVMLAAPFTTGVSVYVFYALQPYLLALYGDEKAYWIAGLAAAIVAGAQIVGGLLVPTVRKMFKKRTTILLIGTSFSALILIALYLMPNFYLVILMVVLWGLIGSATMPVRQAYLNGLIPSKQRATVLSFDSLLGSSGGVVSQPALGKVADIHGYALSYAASGIVQLLAIPFLVLANRQKETADIKKSVVDNPDTSTL